MTTPAFGSLEIRSHIFLGISKVGCSSDCISLERLRVIGLLEVSLEVLGALSLDAMPSEICLVPEKEMKGRECPTGRANLFDEISEEI